jgi:hypothetical protein
LLPTLNAVILLPGTIRRQADGFYDQIPLFYAEKQQKPLFQATYQAKCDLASN